MRRSHHMVYQGFRRHWTFVELAYQSSTAQTCHSCWGSWQVLWIGSLCWSLYHLLAFGTAWDGLLMLPHPYVQIPQVPPSLLTHPSTVTTDSDTKRSYYYWTKYIIQLPRHTVTVHGALYIYIVIVWIAHFYIIFTALCIIYTRKLPQNPDGPIDHAFDIYKHMMLYSDIIAIIPPMKGYIIYL